MTRVVMPMSTHCGEGAGLEKQRSSLRTRWHEAYLNATRGLKNTLGVDTQACWNCSAVSERVFT